MIHQIEIAGTPKPLLRARAASFAGGVRMYDPPANIERKAKIRATWIEAFGDSCAWPAGPVRMWIAAVYPAPSPVAESRGAWKSNGADLDNLVKLAGDALQAGTLGGGLAFADDAQVSAIHASKRYAIEGEPPHLSIGVDAVRERPCGCQRH